MENQELFFTLSGSMCSHAEETLGTDLFLKITVDKATINPMLTYLSTVLYLNSNGKLKMFPNFSFQIAELRNDDWIGRFIDRFSGLTLDCERVIGVVDSSKNLNWYIEFVTNIFGNQTIEKEEQRIVL